MNTRFPLNTLALALAIVGSAKAATMQVDTTAPVQATLLPEVRVVASPARPDAEAEARVAATTPLGVTLLPTVHVNARMRDFAAVLLPTVHVVAEPDVDAGRTVAYEPNPRESSRDTGSAALPRNRAMPK